MGSGVGAGVGTGVGVTRAAGVGDPSACALAAAGAGVGVARRSLSTVMQALMTKGTSRGRMTIAPRVPVGRTAFSTVGTLPRIGVPGATGRRRRRSELRTTLTELKAMAAAARMGSSRRPRNG